MEEKRIGVMTQMSFSSGWFNTKTMNLFVTDQRLIFAFMTKEAKKETERRLNEKVKGKSFKDRLSIIATHGYQLPEYYHEASFETIINEHTNNFVIPLDEIASIKVKRPKTKDSQGFNKNDYFIIKTATKKYRLSPALKGYMEIFNSVLGDRAKVPKIIL